MMSHLGKCSGFLGSRKRPVKLKSDLPLSVQSCHQAPALSEAVVLGSAFIQCIVAVADDYDQWESSFFQVAW